MGSTIGNERGAASNGGPPAISVVIPTYNRWPLVRESVESVLRQDFADFEVVVIDDHSPDGTAEHLRGIDPRVRVVSQTSGPPATESVLASNVVARSGLGRRGAARNEGIRESRGRYVAFLDDDDLYEPWHLSQFADALSRNADFEVFASTGWSWDPKSDRRLPFGSFDPQTLSIKVLTGCVISPVVLVASRRALLDVGGFPEQKEMDGGEDWLLLMKLASRYPFHPLPRPSVKVRMHLGRSMNDHSQIVRAREAVTSAVLEEGLLGQRLDENSRRLFIAGTHRFCAGHLYVAGEMRAARARLGQARRALGWRKGLPWTGKLWLQTWMGPMAYFVRRIKQRLMWR